MEKQQWDPILTVDMIEDAKKLLGPTPPKLQYTPYLERGEAYEVNSQFGHMIVIGTGDPKPKPRRPWYRRLVDRPKGR